MTKMKEKNELKSNTFGLIHIERQVPKEGYFWKKAKIFHLFFFFFCISVKTWKMQKVCLQVYPINIQLSVLQTPGHVPGSWDMDDGESLTSGGIKSYSLIMLLVESQKTSRLDDIITSKNHADIHWTKLSRDLCEILNKGSKKPSNALTEWEDRASQLLHKKDFMI